MTGKVLFVTYTNQSIKAKMEIVSDPEIQPYFRYISDFETGQNKEAVTVT